MSGSALKLDRKDFCCSLCSNLPLEPVTLPCGHSFCLGCIQRLWDGEDLPSCPQCRQTFPERPPLCKNAMLEALMVQLNTMFVTSEENYAAPGEVPCDVCPGKRLKATKSCLNCKVTYCDKHLQSHLNIPQYKNHTLVEPRDSLEEEDCSVHSPQHTGSKTFSQVATSSSSSGTSNSSFSSTSTGPSSGLFIETNSAIGTNKPTFFGSFGSSTGGLSGSTDTTSSPFGTTNSVFGGSTFNTVQKTGVIVKFIPPKNSKTMGKDSFNTRFITKDQCSSATKKCEKESVEKLHQKNCQSGAKDSSNPPVPGTCFIFGSNTVTTSASTGLFSFSTPNTSFSSRQNKTTFSTSTRGFNTSTGSLSGHNQSSTNFNPFSQKTTQSTSFSFGNTASLDQAKPSMGLCGSTAPAQSGSLFGTAQTSTTSALRNSTELFGQTDPSAVSTQSLAENKTTGSITATTSVLSLGSGNSLLSNKPTVTTSTDTTTSIFGLETHTAGSPPPENKPTTGGLETRSGADHDVNLSEEERAHLDLEERRQKIKMKVEQKEKELEELRRTSAGLSSSTDAALKLNRKTFLEMMKLTKKRWESTVQEISSKDYVLRYGIQYLLDYVKEDIAFWEKQKKERAALIFKTKDPFVFMPKYYSLPLIPPPELARLVDPETTAFRRLFLRRPQIPMKVNYLCYFYHGRVDDVDQPKFAREGLLKHWRKITWDANTAHRNISLEPTGGGNPCAMFSATTTADVPDHPDRFSDCIQVLSKEPLTGRCYFEVCSTGGCFLGLTYKSIERKGRGSQCVLGLNDRSWACFGGGFKYKGLNNSDTWVLCPDALNRVGVYLNQEAGTVTFFLVRGCSLCDVHVVETQFTEPLYFGVLFLYPGDRIWVPDIKDKPVC